MYTSYKGKNFPRLGGFESFSEFNQSLELKPKNYSKRYFFKTSYYLCNIHGITHAIRNNFQFNNAITT